MKFRLFCLLFPFFCTISYSQTPITVMVRDGSGTPNAYLAEFQYYEYKVIDSARFKGQQYVFQGGSMKPGIYRVYYSDTLYTDVLYEYDTVQLALQSLDKPMQAEVLKGFSNQLYYDYLFLRDSLMGTSVDSLSYALGQAAGDFRYSFVQMIVQQYQQAWPRRLGTRVVSAMQIPRYSDWSRNNPGKVYSGLREFYTDHFFDNIDFQDTALYNSEVIYSTLRTYFTAVITPGGKEPYKKACDFILQKASVNQGMECYILNTLIDVFANTIFQDVAVYLFDQYYDKKPLCHIPTHKRESVLLEIPEPLTSAGTVLSDIVAKDTSGKVKTLYSVKSRNTLLVFWSPDCENCREDLKEMAKLSSLYKPRDFSVYAFALTKDKVAFAGEARNFPSTWFAVSDLLGLESPLTKQFNVLFTPAYFLLDESKKVRIHTYKKEDVFRAINQSMRR